MRQDFLFESRQLGNKGGLLRDLRQCWWEASIKFIRQGFLWSFITWQSWLRLWEFFSLMPWKDSTWGRISKEHFVFSSDLQLNHFESGKRPNTKLLGKLAFQTLKFATDLWQIPHSTCWFLFFHLMFLIFPFCCQALRCLLPKIRSKPRSLLTIPNHIHLAFHRSNSRVVEFLHCVLSKHT